MGKNRDTAINIIIPKTLFKKMWCHVGNGEGVRNEGTVVKCNTVLYKNHIYILKKNGMMGIFFLKVAKNYPERMPEILYQI